MALEDAVRFVVHATTDDGLRSRLASTTVVGAVGIGNELGYSFSAAELTRALGAGQADDRSLSDEALASVSGGAGVSGGVGSIGSIEGMFISVLNESQQNASQDLKDTAEAIRRNNEEKSKLRHLLGLL
jgi:predicted ribosomally synthesized peptide with nif11-like leader